MVADRTQRYGPPERSHQKAARWRALQPQGRRAAKSKAVKVHRITQHDAAAGRPLAQGPQPLTDQGPPMPWLRWLPATASGPRANQPSAPPLTVTAEKATCPRIAPPASATSDTASAPVRRRMANVRVSVWRLSGCSRNAPWVSASIAGSSPARSGRIRKGGKPAGCAPGPGFKTTSACRPNTRRPDTPPARPPGAPRHPPTGTAWTPLQ